jgi:gluconokinase
VDALVGVDIGTTSVKAVAFDASGAAHGTAERRYELHEPAAGAAEQDPAEVLDAMVEVIRAAVDAATAAGARIAGVSLAAALHSLVALDERDRPLTPLVTWADMRAAEQADRLRAEHPELHDRTGTPLHPMSPLCKLAWFREREPETFAAARRWAGLKELALARLTGSLALDHSCASGTGLMSLASLDWDAEALALAGVDREQLAPLVEPDRILELGAATGTGLSAGTPVVAGAADGPLANLGLGAVRPGVAACSIGTSGALRVVVERPAVDPGRSVFCYALTPGRWVVGGAINNGGIVLRWTGDALAPELGKGAEDELLALAAQAPAGSDGLMMLPYLLGERAPHWTGRERGAYVGLTIGHGRGHLLRAAIEGVSLQMALVLASVRDAGNEVREVRATGGFARSELWKRVLASALGMPIGFPAEHEGSAFGAALLGMEALGMVDSIEAAAGIVQAEEVMEPDPDWAAVYAELLPRFAELGAALTPD